MNILGPLANNVGLQPLPVMFSDSFSAINHNVNADSMEVGKGERCEKYIEQEINSSMNQIQIPSYPSSKAAMHSLSAQQMCAPADKLQPVSPLPPYPFPHQIASQGMPCSLFRH
jgi:hypothetical protein